MKITVRHNNIEITVDEVLEVTTIKFHLSDLQKLITTMTECVNELNKEN